MYTKHYCLLACLLAYPVWHEKINLTSPITPHHVPTKQTMYIACMYVHVRVWCVCECVAKGQLFTHIIHVGLAKEIRNGSKEWRWLLRDKVREKEGEREERGEGERGRGEGERREGEREGRREERKIEREEEREGRERERQRERERESKYLKLYSSLFPMMINTDINAAKLAVRYLKCDNTQYLHIL